MAIKRLNKRNLELAQLLLHGMKQRDAARQLNLSEWHVSRVVHSPVYREYMNQLQEQADNELFESEADRTCGMLQIGLWMRFMTRIAPANRS